MSDSSGVAETPLPFLPSGKAQHAPVAHLLPASSFETGTHSWWVSAVAGLPRLREECQVIASGLQAPAPAWTTSLEPGGQVPCLHRRMLGAALFS